MFVNTELYLKHKRGFVLYLVAADFRRTPMSWKISTPSTFLIPCFIVIKKNGFTNSWIFHLLSFKYNLTQTKREHVHIWVRLLKQAGHFYRLPKYDIYLPIPQRWAHQNTKLCSEHFTTLHTRLHKHIGSGFICLYTCNMCVF